MGRCNDKPLAALLWDVRPKGCDMGKHPEVNQVRRVVILSLEAVGKKKAEGLRYARVFLDVAHQPEEGGSLIPLLAYVGLSKL